ncbi:MAG TPA: hypothetical protein VF366_04395 [Dehalococcoidia bacterium]
MSQDSTRVEKRPATENTSGRGFLQGEIPPEIKEWNWGAFFLTWIWGIGNKVWISFIAIAPFPIGLAMGIVLGIKGNEWAWQCKKWDSIEHFRHRQRIWIYWGIAAFLAPFVFILGWILIIVGLLGYYGYIRL